MDKFFQTHSLLIDPNVNVAYATVQRMSHVQSTSQAHTNLQTVPPFFRDWAARVRARAAELRGTMGGGEGETYDCAITQMAEYEFDFCDDLFIHK